MLSGAGHFGIWANSDGGSVELQMVGVCLCVCDRLRFPAACDPNGSLDLLVFLSYMNGPSSILPQSHACGVLLSERDNPFSILSFPKEVAKTKGSKEKKISKQKREATKEETKHESQGK